MATYYTRVQYIDDFGDTHPIRMSNHVITAQPTAPSTSTAYASRISADVGRSARQYGLRPRSVRLFRTAGTAPDIKTYYDRMPICNPADVTTISSSGTVTINGVAWKVNDFQGEDQN